MSAFITFFDHWGQALWSLSWQLAALVFILWAVSLFCYRQSASFRYLLWCVVLLRLCLPVNLPISIGIGTHVKEAAETSIAAVFVEDQEAVPDITGAEVKLPVDEPVVIELPVVSDTSSVNVAPFAQLAMREPVPLTVKLTAVWIGVVVLLSGLVSYRMVKARVFLRRCLPTTNRRFLELFDDLRKKVGLRRKVKVLTYDALSGIGGPSVFGAMRPCLLVPHHMIEEWNNEELEPVLLHELAHIKRHDLLINAFQIVVQVLFFFHPLVWFANARIRHERELACDDLAIAFCGSQLKHYSQSILRVVEETQKEGWLFSATAIGITEQRHSLGKRIIRIMHKNYRLYKRMGTLSIVGLAMLSGLCIAFAGGHGENKNTEKVGTAEIQSSGEKESVDGIPEQIRTDWKTIRSAVRKYKEQNRGRWPESLQQLGMDLPKDAFSPVNADYHFEPARRGHILSSCGEDGVYGNEDDLLQAQIGKKRQEGLRRELDMVHLRTAVNSSAQHESLGFNDRRPTGSSSISGRVIDVATGEAVGHAKAYLYYYDTSDAIFIDVASNGSYSFRDIPSGKYSLKIIHTSGYQDFIYDPKDKRGQFSLGEGELVEDLVFELERALSVSGRILFEDGAPIPADSQMTVYALVFDEKTGEYKTADQTSAFINGDNYYHLDGLNGRPVYIMATESMSFQTDDPYQPIFYPGTFSRDSATQITFEDGNSAKNIDIVMRKTGGAILEGTVTHADTGLPVFDAHIMVHSEDLLVDMANTHTDEAGYYRFECLGPGQFITHVDASSSGLIRSRKRITIEEFENVPALDFPLIKGATIKGRVVDENGVLWKTTSGYGSVSIKEGGQKNIKSIGVIAVTTSDDGKTEKHSFTYHLGEGLYGTSDMQFSEDGSFEVRGMQPGHIVFYYHPRSKDKKTQHIMHEGKDILGSGLTVEPGQVIEGVQIIIGPEENDPVEPPEQPQPQEMPETTNQKAEPSTNDENNNALSTPVEESEDVKVVTELDKLAKPIRLPKRRNIEFPTESPTHVFNVLGNIPGVDYSTWQNTGLSLHHGDRLYIKTEGLVKYVGNLVMAPDGRGNAFLPSLLNKVSFVSLIGRVHFQLLDDGIDSSKEGLYGPGFVGSAFVMDYKNRDNFGLTGDNVLYLAVNDSMDNDNDYAFKAHIWIVNNGEVMPLEARKTVNMLKAREDKRNVSLTQPYPFRYKDAPTDKISVQYAVLEIGKQMGYHYDWDTSFDNTDPDCRNWIYTEFKDVLFADGMKNILDPFNLTYEIKNRTITLKRK